MDSPFGADSGFFNAHGAKQLEQALRHVSEGWLPVSSEILRSVRAHFKASQSSGSRTEFINELKKDFALFAFCVRELAKKAVIRGQGGHIEPSSLLEQARDDDLRDIILHDARSISIHSLEEISAPQARLIRQAMTAAAAAEALGHASEINPLNAFSLSLLRQLGLSLIAWNYPNVFKRCLASINQSGTLDDALSEVLGFTPTMLGARMGMDWGFSPLMSAGMGDGKSRQEISAAGGELAQRLMNLDKICRISEAFGAAAGSALNRASNYAVVRSEIELMLGSELFKSLQETVARSCEVYAQYAPQFFPSLPDSNHSKNKATRTGIEANVYIKHCEPQTRAELRALYANMKGPASARENVEILIKEIIPESGFRRGAIYLLEPETSRLVPKLVFGDRPISAYQPVNFNSTSSTYDPAASAYRCNSPIMEENVDLGWGLTTYIVGAVGDNPKMGVLLLELNSNREISSPILVFKALRTALCDCLGIQ